MRLGCDWYSLRWQGWDALRLVDYCAELELDSVQLSARRHFDSLDDASLAPVKRRADAQGIQLELSFGSVNKHASSFRPELGKAEEQVAVGLRAAKYLGSPHLHVLLGGVPERRNGVPIGQQIAECVRVSRAVAPLARDLGLKLAFENHGDLLARELLALVEAAGPDVVGVCLDTGNPSTMAEDPLMAVELLAPHALTSHVRDSRVWAVPEGAMAQGVPMGRGSHDFPTIAAILRERAPGMFWDLEVVTGRPPQLLPYFDPASGFWEAFPGMPARDFARFLRVAARGKPDPLAQAEAPPEHRSGPLNYVPPPGELGERLVRQQREHFEESVRYCREVLGLGERQNSKA